VEIIGSNWVKKSEVREVVRRKVAGSGVRSKRRGTARAKQGLRTQFDRLSLCWSQARWAATMRSGFRAQNESIEFNYLHFLPFISALTLARRAITPPLVD
jgi:hypothetical protein